MIHGKGGTLSEATERRTAGVVDFVPATWFSRPAESAVWLTGYRVFRVDRESVALPRIVDMQDVRAVLMFGTVSCLRPVATSIDPVSGGAELQIDTSGAEMRPSEEGTYLFLLTPSLIDGVERPESAVREAISVAAAALVVVNGRNIIYERLFDNVVHLGTGQTTAFSAVVENPLWFPAPDVSDRRLALAQRVADEFARRGEFERNRLRLSLRWFESGLFDSGVDALLDFWIALETLSMPDTTDIRPINESLARAYSCSLDEARVRFEVGRIYGLRNQIVHAGSRTAIHASLLSYIEAVYVDVLFEHLGLPHEGRAATRLRTSELDVAAYLRTQTGR